ncbi:unnamed protein product [Malus baccata var. baccata]
MTRSSQPVHKHIFEFDDDFERTLTRARNQQDPQPSQLAPDLEEDKVEEQEEATTRTFEEVQDMAVDNRTIKELSSSGLDNALPLCIQYPRAAQDKTVEFKLKSSLLHHIPKFHGLSMEDPNKHLKEFEVVCSRMTPVNVDGSILKMKAFPFSLLEKAKDWLYELALGTVTSWESMKRAFLEKFFPTSRVILLRKRISGIQQNQGESFPTYYECFKTFVASCPQHQMKEKLILQYFYEGLLPIERQMLDASAGGALVDKTPMATKTLIANRALNAQQYEGVGQRDNPRQQLMRFMQSKKDKSDKDILDTFRKVQVNIPLLDAIKQVPKYAKFLKELCTTRKMASNKEVVNHLVFPADFYVLEMEDSNHFSQLPILLGRPFMKTSRTKIDVFKGTLTMEFDGEVIDFNISDAMRYPHDGHSCFSIDVIDSWAHEFLNDLNEDALEKTLTQSIGLKNEGLALRHAYGNNKEHLVVPIQEELVEMVAALKSNPKHIGKSPNLISIPISTNKLLPSVIQPPSLKLKTLHSHLKYVFLGEQETLPVIISSSLTAQEEDKLVRVLWEYRTAIGGHWPISRELALPLVCIEYSWKKEPNHLEKHNAGSIHP